MNVSVIGLGLIGGSVAIDLRNSGFATQLIGVDSDAAHCDKAIELALVDKLLPLEQACEMADVVLLAVPVSVIQQLLPVVLDKVKDSTTVIDLGSTKQSISKVVAEHARRKNYVAAHPMSGTENSGPTAAMANLFVDKITIICDQELSAPQHLALSEKLFQVLGSSIAYMSSKEQDYSTAYISHLPHVVAYALANAVMAQETDDIIFELASGGFNSTVRLAKSSPSMWGPIFQDNKDYILEGIDGYVKQLTKLRDAIANDEQEMYRLMDNAIKIRGVLEGEHPSMIKNENKIIKLYTK